MPQERDTVILLDWDDTLLCSSFLQEHGLRLDTPLADLSVPEDPLATLEEKQAREVAVQIRELEAGVHQLLTTCIAAHRTVIVTNAEQGWVQLSAARFFPSVVPLLASLSVISARSTFEPLFPGCPLKWKYYCCHSVLVGGGFFGVDGRKEVDKHVISLGDSHVEREAVRALCRGVPACRTKTVKFSERPTAEQLRRQLELVLTCFSYITGHEGDLDLQLTVTVNANANAPPAAPADEKRSLAVSPESADSDVLSHSEAKDLTPVHASASKQITQEGSGCVSSMVDA